MREAKEKCKNEDILVENQFKGSKHIETNEDKYKKK